MLQRNLRTILICAVTVLGVIVLTGCAQDDLGREIQARDAYIGVLKTLDTEKQAGHIPETTLKGAVVPSIVATRSALNEWQTNATATPPVSSSAAQLAYNAAFAGLQQVLSNIQADKLTTGGK